MPTYTVQQGDCLSSIAAANGMHWRTLWNDANNATLRNLRKDPNVLFPGDSVFIRDFQDKQVPGPTAQRHTFQKLNTPARLRLRLLDADNNPRGNIPYSLQIDGTLFTGNTDGDGRIQQPIPPDAQCARLTLFGPQNSVLDAYKIALGGLDPIATISGIQQRLTNLGYTCRPFDGILGPLTANALNSFQADNHLPLSGQIDDATRAALQKSHGS